MIVVNREFLVQNIKSLCQKKGMYPTVACRNSGVGNSFINDLERGKTPSVSKVQMLANYLGVTTSQLLGETEKPASISESGLNEEQLELVDLFRAASPDLRAAALAVLRSAEEKDKAQDGVLTEKYTPPLP